jgi:hypothetical protein
MQQHRKPTILAGILLLTCLGSAAATSVDPQQYASLALGMLEADVLEWLGPPDETLRTPHILLVANSRETERRIVTKHVVVYLGGCCAATTTLTFIDGLLVAKEFMR